MPSVTFKLAQGAKVRDIVTGFTGTIVVQSYYLNKCVRYGVQPMVTEKNPDKIPDVIMFDEDQLVPVDEKPVVLKQARTGGPFPTPKEAR